MNKAMEQALGRLAIDDAFRDAFFRDPAVPTDAADIPLTGRERRAPYPAGHLAAFKRCLGAKDVGHCCAQEALA